MITAQQHYAKAEEAFQQMTLKTNTVAETEKWAGLYAYHMTQAQIANG